MAETHERQKPGRGWRERVRNSPMGNIAAIGITALVVVVGLWIVNGVGGDDEKSAAAKASSGTSAVELTGATKGAAPAVGKVAPGFEALSIDGNPVSLATLEGKPTWLVFGATWCSNCRAESPDIQAVQEAYRDRVGIVGVYVGESNPTVSAYAKRLGLTFTQVADAQTALGSSYRVMGVPMHVFVDASGKVRAIAMGALTEKEARSYLDDMLRDAPTSAPAAAEAG